MKNYIFIVKTFFSNSLLTCNVVPQIASMTDGHVTRVFPAKHCLWPVLDEMFVRQMCDKPQLSHQELGSKLRQMLTPVHFTCVPDVDLTCVPPKYLNYDPLGRQSQHPDKLIKAKDLSKDDLAQMPESEAEYKRMLRARKKCLPFGWWDMQQYTYKY